MIKNKFWLDRFGDGYCGIVKYTHHWNPEKRKYHYHNKSIWKCSGVGIFVCLVNQVKPTGLIGLNFCIFALRIWLKPLIISMLTVTADIQIGSIFPPFQDEVRYSDVTIWIAERIYTLLIQYYVSDKWWTYSMIWSLIAESAIIFERNA